MKAWLKGGLIGLAVGFVYLIIASFIIGAGFSDVDVGNLVYILIPLMPSIKACESIGLSSFCVFISDMLLFIVVGALNGLLIEKTKSKKQN